MSEAKVKTREFNIIVQAEENKQVFTRRKKIILSQALLNDPALLAHYHRLNISQMLAELNHEMNAAAP